jgi:general secretion pathway protein A
MYNDHFQLDGTPFSIAPDPRYLYMSAQHREALAHLLYGVDAGGGFVLLTGEVGAGKTTVCRCFLQQVGAHCRVAYIFNPRLSAAELLQVICQEFAIALPATSAPDRTRELVEALNRHLLASHARGEHNLLIIDEAQNLSADVLEQLRLLTNLETNERKLLQIILIGQPELRQQVQQPALEQLAQRIIARYHLGPLSVADCRAYIVHRLAVAGARSAPLFSDSAMRAVHQVSGGVPRKINLVCDRALLAAYSRNQARVNTALVRQAASEIFADGKVKSLRQVAGAAVAVLATLAVALAYAWRPQQGEAGPATLAMPNAVAAATAAAGASPAVASALGTSAVTSGSATSSATQSAPSDSAASSIKQSTPGTLPLAASGNAPSGLPMLDGAALHQLALGEEQMLPHLATAWGGRADGERAQGEPAVSNATCANLASTGLFCYRLRAGLGQARELDRPFLLKLKSPVATGGAVGAGAWVLVREMNGHEARLESRQGVARIRLPLLEAASAGEVLSLWRMDPAFRVQLTVGMRGPDVDWLARQLARWESGSVEAGIRDVQMDVKLVDRVRQFQQLQGLDADGLVGPRTWMKLHAIAGQREPRLQAPLNLASR